MVGWVLAHAEYGQGWIRIHPIKLDFRYIDMDEQTANTKYRRKPFVALILSLLEPGLGHIYCGRIAKGFVLASVFSVFLPFIYINLVVSESRIRIGVIILSLLISVAFLIIVVVDSYQIARKTRPDYELKDYNRWYIYLVFLLLVKAGSEQINENYKTNFIEAYRVPHISMFPTVSSGDMFLANKTAYKTEDPKRGDVVVLVSPQNRHQDWVKRVVAVAGDKIEIREGSLYINGERCQSSSVGQASVESPDGIMHGDIVLEENGDAEYRIFAGSMEGNRENFSMDFPPFTVPPYYCFVLGDNRNFSADSRTLGPIPLSTVKGRAEYIYWPAKDWSQFGRIK